MLHSAGIVVVVATALLVVSVLGDLPVHCLREDTVGEWKFDRSKLGTDKYISCGHSQPDSNYDNLNDKAASILTDIDDSISIRLDDPNLAYIGEDVGNWTMVYDEGMSIDVAGFNYFAFFKYVSKTEEGQKDPPPSDQYDEYISICSETLVGWYRTLDMKQWGCFKATQLSSATVGKKQHVLHNSKTGPILSNSKKTKNKKSKRKHKHKTRLHSKFVDSKSDTILPHIVSEAEERFSQVFSVSPIFGLLEQSSEFVPDSSYIDFVNSNTESMSWTAKSPDHLKGASLSSALLQMGATSKFTKPSPFCNVKSQDVDDLIDTKEFPDELDWREFDPPVYDQGDCGSCYVMAFISALETRIRIASKMKDKTRLSTEAILSCSRYNEGCDGGFPFLAAKQTYEFGVVPEECFKYVGKDMKCSDSCTDSKRYYIDNFEYVGGFYGGCSEKAMLKAIQKGPIVVAINAPSDLYYYDSGIFKGHPSGSHHKNINYVCDGMGHKTRMNPFQKTNHALVAVGYGSDSNGKYWILKNTWGAGYGEDGYVKFERGNDLYGIESMAVTFDYTHKE